MLRVLALALLVAAPCAIAQPADELTSLKQEQARLHRSLDEIDRRIRALEGANSPFPAAAVPTANPVSVQSIPPLVALQRNWSEIKSGTPKAHVNELLGTPEREMRINGDLVWYYVYPGIGQGSVFFST